ncbi:uncharacterized protein BP5553_03418 [Venustampulla echinocandica]|uniref:Transmembrane protein n=1 Tax=Venustampulla echinocandica TaxID=2656787 RepID=A0A370TUB5_9HELO|nr:uncharacterized protein BP5553_03418 [Venustampulla echinocandica]RDL39078.1 hypothetical protein BP5553_03418 [Venustampulla echinocandica]
MAFRRWRSRHACQCTKSRLRFSSTLLFLSMVLPESSLAQLTDQPSPSGSVPITLTISPSASSTSLTRSSNNTSTGAIPTTPITPDDSGIPPSIPPGDPSITDEGAHVFNYYFLIALVAAVFFGVFLLYAGRRKKRKAALLQSHSRQALAQDVAGFRTRLGRARNHNGSGFRLRGGGNGHMEEGSLEGLDERGMAPPPYVPTSKRSSLRGGGDTGGEGSGASREIREGEGVELRTLSPERDQNRMSDPPGYDEHAGSRVENSAHIPRPSTAVLASDRYGSTGRLLNSDGRSFDV